jgi:hypothetical protein
MEPAFNLQRASCKGAVMLTRYDMRVAVFNSAAAAV